VMSAACALAGSSNRKMAANNVVDFIGNPGTK